MSDRGESAITDLLAEIRVTRDEIQRADATRMAAIAGKADKAEVVRLSAEVSGKVAALETAVKNLSIKVGRPGGGSDPDSAAGMARQSARSLLELKHQLRTPKSSPGEMPYSPNEPEIEEAELALKGLHHLFKATSVDQLPLIEHKALTAFSMGASGFILVPEMSDKILSCLVDMTDLAGMVSNVTISGPSIKFMVDNVRLANAGWACDSTCFANNPPANFTEDLGELEIKAETIRFAVCSSRDILEDASFNVESWMFGKVSAAFRNTISEAIMTGTGVGMPLGLLHRSAGLPVCDTGPNTPAGQIAWQDLISLKFEVPIQWHADGVYLCNQRTFGQLLTMSDALGRPLMIATPVEPARWVINGSPVVVNTWMPDIAPGAAPILYGNLKQTYMLVNRKQTTMLQDPYSMGYCIVFKFEARVGGNIICSNASRLLRIR
jgi:HK97 family phage major capsid protein